MPLTAPALFGGCGNGGGGGGVPFRRAAALAGDGARVVGVCAGTAAGASEWLVVGATGGGGVVAWDARAVTRAGGGVMSVRAAPTCVAAWDGGAPARGVGGALRGAHPLAGGALALLWGDGRVSVAVLPCGCVRGLAPPPGAGGASGACRAGEGAGGGAAVCGGGAMLAAPVELSPSAAPADVGACAAAPAGRVDWRGGPGQRVLPAPPPPPPPIRAVALYALAPPRRGGALPPPQLLRADAEVVAAARGCEGAGVLCGAGERVAALDWWPAY
jgi:hypothetical protein